MCATAAGSGCNGRAVGNAWAQRAGVESVSACSWISESMQMYTGPCGTLVASCRARTRDSGTASNEAGWSSHFV
jgi:hypothetical protein